MMLILGTISIDTVGIIKYKDIKSKEQKIYIMQISSIIQPV